MGAYNNILNRCDGRRRRAIHTRRLLIAALVLGIAAATAAASSSDDPAADPIGPDTRVTDETAQAHETDAPVSTRPLLRDARSSASKPAAAGSGAERTPLTRAASQQRVNGMSPVAWLAGYGHVTIERTE